MIRIPLAPGRHLGVTTFRWGVYLQLRWDLTWRHVKVGAWTQRGLRLSTRYQASKGKPRRYAHAVRIAVTTWSSSKGRPGKPLQFGVMLYAGRGALSEPGNHSK